MPDAEPFHEAEAQRLHGPAMLTAQAQRMLQDPKSSALVENFGVQWLNLRLMDRTKPDSDRFVAVDDELLDATRQETRMLAGVGARFNSDEFWRWSGWTGCTL